MPEPPRQIRVLIVDDSAYNRRALTTIMQSSPRIEVIGTAFDGEDAIRKVIKLKPDAVTLDLEMPRMDGFALLRWLMVNHPVPVFVVSARESNRSVFKALDLGAADFIVKPQATVPNFELIRDEIVGKITGIEKLDVDKLARRAYDAPRLALPAVPPLKTPAQPPGSLAGVIAIAASTGGPPAVQQVLTALGPASHRVATLVAQHMPPVFTGLFAERLDRLLPQRVKEAEEGEPLLPGTVYILPGGRCGVPLRDGEGWRIALRDKRPEERYSPSADALFHGVAGLFGPVALGLVLTGMGDDGADGSAALIRAGAEVYAESAETAVIFGMPQEALKTSGVRARALPQLAADAAAWAAARCGATEPFLRPPPARHTA